MTKTNVAIFIFVLLCNPVLWSCAILAPFNLVCDICLRHCIPDNPTKQAPHRLMRAVEKFERDFFFSSG
jgi:hypothetical protein